MAINWRCDNCAGTVQVDAHNAMLTLCEFSYVALPFGIATAATIRDGNMLGAGNYKTAKTSGKAHIACTCAAICVLNVPVQACSEVLDA